MLKLKPIHKQVMNEAASDPRVEKYAKFLEDDVSKMIDDSGSKNAEALKLINQEFADVVRANPGLLGESIVATRLMSEMSRHEAVNVFDQYAQFMDKEARKNLHKAGADRSSIERLHDNVVDIATNIRDYPSLQASIALELSNVQYYQEGV